MTTKPILQQRFKEIVDIRGGDYKDTIFSFGVEEGEVYALCRWLRARKFVFTDVIQMVDEATKCQAEAKAAGYYPDPESALGCRSDIYQAQYPQVYSGVAKNGVPVFFSKTGVLNIEAVECITTVANIVKYHWYVEIHDFAGRLRQYKAKNPEFTRFEAVTILDMAQLTVGQLNSRTMAIIKEQSAIDSLCFPETMNKMFIINAPRFFTATWTIIKGWIDPRTANKVEVLGPRKTWEPKLLEYIDADQLPSDYGGTGPNTQDTMEKEGFKDPLKRLHTQLISIRYVIRLGRIFSLAVRFVSHIIVVFVRTLFRSTDSTTFNIFPGEELNVTVFTRSTTGAKFTVVDAHGNTTYAYNVTVKHHSDDEKKLPSNVSVTKANIKGPASVKVKAESMGSRFVTSASNYLVVFSVY